MRDDRPFGGRDPAAAIYFYSRNRGGEHPSRHLAAYAGILQADAYAGFADLYRPDRKPGPIREAACWAHGRRKFFVLADVAKAPLAIEAVRRIDAIFAIERDFINRAAENLPESKVARQACVAFFAAPISALRRAQMAGATVALGGQELFSCSQRP